MDEKTREALEGSIAKWQAIVHGTGGDYGVSNCPLCALFYHQECEGCPVADATGIICCGGSPYDLFAGHDIWYLGIKADTEELQQAAQKELDFLISLRPKD